MTPRCLVCGDAPRHRGCRCVGCYHWHRRHRNTAPVLLQAQLATKPDAVTVLRILAVLEPSPALLRCEQAATRLQLSRAGSAGNRGIPGA